jgi:hypothetical protein
MFGLMFSSKQKQAPA